MWTLNLNTLRSIYPIVMRKTTPVWQSSIQTQKRKAHKTARDLCSFSSLLRRRRQRCCCCCCWFIDAQNSISSRQKRVRSCLNYMTQDQLSMSSCYNCTVINENHSNCFPFGRLLHFSYDIHKNYTHNKPTISTDVNNIFRSFFVFRLFDLVFVFIWFTFYLIRIL